MPDQVRHDGGEIAGQARNDGVRDYFLDFLRRREEM